MKKRTLILASVSATLALLAGCATSSGPKNLAETIAADPQLSAASQLIANAGLDETLRGPGPFTVFVPSNEAIGSVSAAMQTRLKDAAAAKTVLSFHVVPGTLLATDVKNSSVKSVQGASLALSRSGSFVTVEDAVVTRTDIIATNGVVHVIDRVLTPPKQ
ncbi:fasciclin domain-containing protein [Aquabacterium sp.]|uniref:fasciclin domain-containing protein n=1 Tax=Aquabacterium sp. TaxID=1872578 RepID=UPI0035B17ACA